MRSTYCIRHTLAQGIQATRAKAHRNKYLNELLNRIEGSVKHCLKSAKCAYMCKIQTLEPLCLHFGFLGFVQTQVELNQHLTPLSLSFLKWLRVLLLHNSHTLDGMLVHNSLLFNTLVGCPGQQFDPTESQQCLAQQH